MSNDLRPMVLEDLGLEAALRAVTEEAGDSLPLAHVSYHVLGVERRLPAEIELTIYRVAQEALTNTRKHAQSATCMEVVLAYEPATIRLSVKDDGPGFSARELDDWLREEHLGLAGMHERAALLGGALEVTARPGVGTQVVLQLCDHEVGA